MFLWIEPVVHDWNPTQTLDGLHALQHKPSNEDRNRRLGPCDCMQAEIKGMGKMFFPSPTPESADVLNLGQENILTKEPGFFVLREYMF